MKTKKEKEVILSLIKDDLVNHKLLLGLDALGLRAADYYLNIGVNRSFALGKRCFFYEFQFDYNVLASKTKTHLISFKLAYVFKYSTDFSSSTR